MNGSKQNYMNNNEKDNKTKNKEEKKNKVKFLDNYSLYI